MRDGGNTESMNKHTPHKPRTDQPEIMKSPSGRGQKTAGEREVMDDGAGHDMTGERDVMRPNQTERKTKR